MKIILNVFNIDYAIIFLLIANIILSFSIMAGIGKMIELQKLTWNTYFNYLKAMSKLLDIEIDLDEFEDVFKDV